MKTPSASNVESFVMCTSSHVLPQHEAHSAAGRNGTFSHDLLSSRINKRRLASNGDESTVKHFPLDQYLAELTDVQAETAYAVDVAAKTSRYLGKDLGRAYGSLGPTEIATTLDVQGIRPDGKPWIRDWKFGRTASWWQLYTQAMAIMWLPENKGKVLEVDAGFVFIDPGTGGRDHEEDPATLYAMDMEDRADEIVKAFSRAYQIASDIEAQRPVKTVEGTWCTYCGAYPYCPSKTRLVRAMLSDLGDFDTHISAMTVEQCGQAWLKLKEIKRLAEKIEDTLKARMEVEPFPLPNGKRLRMVETKGWPYFDREPTRALLVEKGATEAEIQKVMKMRAGSKSAKETK